jgi:hypothetical protein
MSYGQTVNYYLGNNSEQASLAGTVYSTTRVPEVGFSEVILIQSPDQ